MAKMYFTKKGCALVLRKFSEKYAAQWESLRYSGDPKNKQANHAKATADAYMAAALFLETDSMNDL